MTATTERIAPYWRLFAGLSGLCALVVAIRPLNFLSDDSLFYLVIADFIARGHGSTFNGLFPTNGYHPLWELVASTLALIPHTKRSLLVLGLAVQWLLQLAMMWILLDMLRTVFSRGALAVFVAVMLVFFVPFGNLYWTEAPLSMFFLALILAIMARQTPIRYVPLGLLFGLLFLSRLDNVFLIGCCVIGLFLRDRDWRLAIACLVCAGVGSLYLVLNLAQFGHLMPISGAVKSAAYRHVYLSGSLGNNGLISLAGAIGLALNNTLRSSRPLQYRVMATSLAGGVILQSAYVFALTYGDTSWVWYYVAGYLCVALLAAEIVSELRVAWLGKVGTVALATAALASLGVASLKFVLNSSLHDPSASSGNWRERWIETVARTVPEDGAALVVFDQPGVFAYGSDHPVLAMDGLTNNYQVEADMVRAGMYPQIARLRHSYLVAPWVAEGGHVRAQVTGQTGLAGNGQIIHFSTPLLGADAGCIQVDGSGLLAKFDAPALLQGGSWGIWRLDEQTLRQVPCPAGDPVPVRSDAYFARF
jgi:hypothetical protein